MRRHETNPPFVAVLVGDSRRRPPGLARARSAQLIDDRAITVHSTREVAEKRHALIQYLWGAEGFPATAAPPPS